MAANPQSAVTAGGKPFQNLDRGPTLSPYLSLDLIESSTAIPNYYQFVLPQIRQQQANEAQSREIQRLRQQVRVASDRGFVVDRPAGGMPTTGNSSQFMNLGDYFPGITR